jgi:hypothetical protein
MANSVKQKFVFVVGAWRSRTSGRHALLKKHPHLSLMFEAEPFGLGRDKSF